MDTPRGPFFASVCPSTCDLTALLPEHMHVEGPSLPFRDPWTWGAVHWALEQSPWGQVAGRAALGAEVCMLNQGPPCGFSKHTSGLALGLAWAPSEE